MLLSLCDVIISLLTSLSVLLPFLPVHVVLEGIVAAQRYQRPQAQSVGEEDLRPGIDPHLKGSMRGDAASKRNKRLMFTQHSRVFWRLIWALERH